ncbi:MAG: phosphatase PAP2 family protein [Ignavibacteriaceae bacterium]|nr:phosphatase PAP2 family protein [Ignavibacteriaceae bacterium]
MIILNAVVILSVITIAYKAEEKDTFLRRQIRYWYGVPLIMLTFKELYVMIKPMRGVDYDHYLILIDRWIFGFDPTVELLKIASPLLTEFLQIIYATFYFLPMILAGNLLKKDKKLEADYTIFSIIFGFFVSYIGYMLVPAIGPRFHLHDFEMTNTELPGLFLTNFLREIINMGESIPAGTPNPAEVVQRDVFPSGHTMMTAITMYLAVRFKSPSKWLLLPVGTLLIFSTVYLRYHYAIDVIAGLLCMALSLWLGRYYYNYYARKTGRKEISNV